MFAAKRIIVTLGALLISLFAHDATARPITKEQVEDIFTRYLAIGQSNIDIHISLIGSDGVALTIIRSTITETAERGGLDSSFDEESRRLSDAFAS